MPTREEAIAHLAASNLDDFALAMTREMRRTAHKSQQWTSPFAGWYDLFSSKALPMPNTDAFNNLHADQARTNAAAATAASAVVGAQPSKQQPPVSTEQLRSHLNERSAAEQGRFAADLANSDSILNALYEANAPERDIEDQARTTMRHLRSMAKTPIANTQYPLLASGFSHMPYSKLSQHERLKQRDLVRASKQKKLPSASPTYKNPLASGDRIDQLLNAVASPAELQQSASHVASTVKKLLGAVDPADLVRDIPHSGAVLSAASFNDMLRASPLVTSSRVAGGIAFGRIVTMSPDVADVDIGGKLNVRIPVPAEAVLSVGLLVPVLILSSEITFSFIGQRKTSSALRGNGVHVGALLRHELFTQERLNALHERALSAFEESRLF